MNLFSLPETRSPESYPQPITKYRISKIPKGHGKYRTIYRVDPHTSSHLRSLLPYLEDKLTVTDVIGANYAFVKGKNSVLNALQHIGFDHTLSFDLQDFFDSVTAEHLKKIVSDEVISSCFIDGAPRQGLPTSPLIATIAFLKCDECSG